MGIWTIPDFRDKIQYFKDPFACSQSMLQHVIDGMNLIDRHVEEREVRDEHHELAHGKTVLQHFSGSEPEYHGPAKTPDQHHARRVVGPEIHGTLVRTR